MGREGRPPREHPQALAGCQTGSLATWKHSLTLSKEVSLDMRKMNKVPGNRMRTLTLIAECSSGNTCNVLSITDHVQGQGFRDLGSGSGRDFSNVRAYHVAEKLAGIVSHIMTVIMEI